MNRNYKSRLQEIVPSTRFGQGLIDLKYLYLIRFCLGLASLFYLKRHKKRDDYGRAPVVSRLRAQSTLQMSSSASYITMPFEVLTSIKTSTPPPPIQIETLKYEEKD
jgi:hypothetical protein